MSRVSKFFLIAFFAVSCTNLLQNETPIVTPVVDRNFYLNSIEIIKDKLEKRPNDKTLVNSLLYFYQALGWPEGSSFAFERAASVGLIDQQLLVYQMDFYFTKGYLSELEYLVSKLDETETLPVEVWLIKAKYEWQKQDTAAAKKSMLKAREYPQSAKQIFESSRFFLALQDTALALSEAKNAFQQLSDDLVFRRYYADLLFHAQLHQEVNQLLPLLPGENEDTRLSIAKSYKETNQLDSAISILQHTRNKGNLFTLANWYIEMQRIDSARKVYDYLQFNYPQDTSIFLARAQLEESVGYFTKSLEFLDYILTLDSLHRTATNQKEMVLRKIAYLQKIREQQKAQTLPTLEFKKIN